MLVKAVHVCTWCLILLFLSVLGASSLKRKSSHDNTGQMSRVKRAAGEELLADIAMHESTPLDSPAAIRPSPESDTLESIYRPQAAPKIINTLHVAYHNPSYTLISSLSIFDMFVYRAGQSTPPILVQVLQGKLKLSSKDPFLFSFILYPLPDSKPGVMPIPNEIPITLPAVDRVFLIVTKHPMTISISQWLLNVLEQRDFGHPSLETDVELVFELTP